MPVRTNIERDAWMCLSLAYFTHNPLLSGVYGMAQSERTQTKVLHREKDRERERGREREPERERKRGRGPEIRRFTGKALC